MHKPIDLVGKTIVAVELATDDSLMRLEFSDGYVLTIRPSRESPISSANLTLDMTLKKVEA